jgi:hypothetical protein
MRRALLLLLAACGNDPCDGIDGRCIALRIESSAVDRIDDLELDVLYGDRHGNATTSDGVVELPITTAVELPGDGAIDVSIVAAGKLAGSVVGTGAGQTTLAANAHGELAIMLGPVEACDAGAFYCGEHKVAGDPGVLYQCTANGAPRARGRCVHGCIEQPTPNDFCDNGPDTCPADGKPCCEGGFYCGGDKIDGDPQSLYVCMNGAGANRMVCPNGCVIGEPGHDDYCR